jgi:aldehyde dehydrogenase (NAD+)
MNETTDPISKIFYRQKEFFKTGATQKLEYRRKKLHDLLQSLDEFEEKICQALAKDLGKGSGESYLSEIGFLKEEISHTLKNLKKWIRPQRVPTPMTLFPARSFIRPEALGTVLIIAPWNYPFQLLVSPLIGALAAGNTVVLKPSEVSEHTALMAKDLIQSIFKEEEVALIEGAIPETTSLLKLPFDHIFYTGNGEVGKIVMKAAAEHLVPVTLELGGKSPCFVFNCADLSMAAKRIAWGKFFNCGQTCVAPDYLLIDKQYREQLVQYLIFWIKSFYGKNPLESQEYGKIINNRHFQRLSRLINKEKVLFGGELDEGKDRISPTILEANLDDEIMKDEIFGPLLPILEFDNIKEAIEVVLNKDKPLACYLFTQDKEKEKQVLEKVSAGGVCINDTIVHLTNTHLPFGGVGGSGMGAYHGYFSFKTFSHFKAVVKRWFIFDLKLRYPPYIDNIKLIKKITAWLG